MSRVVQEVRRVGRERPLGVLFLKVYPAFGIVEVIAYLRLKMGWLNVQPTHFFV